MQLVFYSDLVTGINSIVGLVYVCVFRLIIVGSVNIPDLVLNDGLESAGEVIFIRCNPVPLFIQILVVRNIGYVRC